MADACTTCHAEPRHGSSPKCVRCLWPERSIAELTFAWPRPGDRWRSRLNGIVAEVVAVDSTSVTYSVDGPDGGTWTVPRAMFVDGCEREPRSKPAGLTDAGSTPRPSPPCCRRIGAWWCLREQGHAGECYTPHTREVELPAADFGPRRGR